MKLTNYSNYAMRSLQLAALKAPDLVRIEDVARVHNLSRPHIMKIVHELGRAGYLETVRGRGGGFRLARPAEEIVVGEVVRITEGPLDVVECFNSEKNTCPLMGVCVLSNKMQEATNAFMAVLDDLTVADIAANRGELMARLAPLENPQTEEAKV
ncbi:RrF2 family transcriptional regulator [Sulfitobacter donghicola]|uniref:Rrf2 family transcriptional regulator n=1 Tax=Sulfitobacter donghicola DSW-25 = KCTC 12864 = JCM 14565 TaxID=1300350 RepID=A0A073IME9_9RHOB|nr:Rrf2 family transcriptional regulator [Sulfitobacter donghicola]KEJ90770.1 Rrf2 family transcriptional regulator [Sulfitobacter donghicola DSW-25 = KCTC 12864 = JCM 14565]KIN68029.1 HTH-type transcriptional regulator NsrR [Sulfitobacter donghicola DSW-25 = KCTC 12864 = JCM 14565]